MYVEMVCNCDSSFSIESDGENPESVWALTWRFANAHVKCGFVTPGTSAEIENETTVKKRIIKPKAVTKDDEEE